MGVWRRVLRAGLLGGLALLAACGTVAPAAAPIATSTDTPLTFAPTSIASAISAHPAPNLTAYAAATLTVAEMGAEVDSAFSTAEAAETRGALTTVPLQQTALARPTPTLYTFPPTPDRISVPTPTMIVGRQPLEDCMPQIHGFNPSNCWVVLLDKEYIHVYAGYLYNVRSGDLADESIGALVLFTESLNQIGVGPTERYPTPQEIGPVVISEVRGSRITVRTLSPLPTPIVFVFELRTRQWVAP